MRKLHTRSQRRVIFPFVLIIVLLTACNPTPPPVVQADSAVVQIIAPIEGSQLTAGEWVDVDSILTDSGGAIAVLLEVNGTLLRKDQFTTPMQQGNIIQPWQPKEPGTYTLQTYLQTSQGELLPSNQVVVIVGETLPESNPQVPTTVDVEVAPPAITITPSLIPAETPMPNLGPPMATAIQDANCRYGPGQVYAVIGYLLQDQTAPIVGRNAETTWWVIERVDNSATCWIWDGVVTVSGDTSNVPVVTPPPTPTSTPTQTPSPVPLAAPDPIAPSGSLSCRSTVFLEWQPVSHPNGIDHYEWQVTGPGGTDSGSATSTSVEYFVNCAASYSWQVRAVDGKGNVGTYSDPVNFSIE